MDTFFQKHRRGCIIVGGMLAIALFALYLHALLQPGFWHREAFLYLQDDGRFVGNDDFSVYQMELVREDLKTDIFFSVDETRRHYQVLQNADDKNVQIFEDDVQVFRGVVMKIGDAYFLENENKELVNPITVIAGGVKPDLEEQFPGYTQLYNWAISEDCEVRGNLMYLFYAIIAMLVLLLDVIFPNLFWNISHALAVDGGEPSAFYRFGQVTSRVFLLLTIFVCMINSFGVR